MGRARQRRPLAVKPAQVVLLDEPTAALDVPDHAGLIVSRKAAQAATEDFDSGKAAIGTGPYKFVSWTPKEQLVLDRFDGFWGPKEPWARHVRKEIAATINHTYAGRPKYLMA